MKLHKGVALLCAMSATPVLADSIDVNLKSDALRATYTMQLQSTKGLSGEVGLLYTEESNNDSDLILHGGMMVSGENWSKSGTFDISLGGRLLYATPGNLDMLAVAFGGSARFSPIPRLGIGAHFYYAPDITAFMDSDSYREVGLRVDYQVLPQAFVYLGTRDIEVDFGDAGNWEADSGIHIGYRMMF